MMLILAMTDFQQRTTDSHLAVCNNGHVHWLLIYVLKLLFHASVNSFDFANLQNPSIRMKGICSSDFAKINILLIISAAYGDFVCVVLDFLPSNSSSYISGRNTTSKKMVKPIPVGTLDWQERRFESTKLLFLNTEEQIP